MTQRNDDRRSHSDEACERILEWFFLEPDAPLQVVGKREPAPESERAVIELLGNALWDVFSQNHTIVDAEGIAYDLGSFRGSAGFIAEAIDRAYPQLGVTHDYLDFYMGTSLHATREDLPDLYRWIFERLRAAGCRWIYSFPRMYLVDLRGSRSNDDMLSYDPGEAIRAEIEQATHAEETDALAGQLEDLYREDLERARHKPLPDIVAAYRAVFGELPEGWPHHDM